MNIAPILKVDREKMGAMRILLVIDDGVYVSIYVGSIRMCPENINNMHSYMTFIFHN